MLYKLLDEIRRRPGMYIGDENPSTLKSFLHGFFYDKPDQYEWQHFNTFHDWVAKKLNYTSSISGWAYMIEDQRDDKEEALWLFFELLDEFRGIQHQQIAQTPFNHKESLDHSHYSRFRKIRGSFEQIPKPYPSRIVIEKIVLHDVAWFSMIARGEKNEILDVWNCDDLETAFKRAEEIFGIKESEWDFIQTS
jgi:hypothetical protein